MNGFYTLIYNFVISVYVLSIRIAALFNSKAKSWVQGRKNILLLIKNTIDVPSVNAWFHCASLGEFEQCRPLIERYKQTFPEHKIVLTFFSPSGYETQRNYDKADYIFYLPIDSKKNAAQFITLVKPKIAIFVKYEFWLHYLNTLSNRKIPAILVSGIFRTDQLFFKSFGKPFRTILNCYTQLFVQDTDSLQLLNSIGVNNARIAPDTRFDRVAAIAKENYSSPVIEKFCNKSKVFIAGSTWPEDEKILSDFYVSCLEPNSIKLIIAPHEINNKHINGIKQQFKNVTLFSNGGTNENSSILIIDSIGLLSRLYRFGNWAYVGGGFTNGIHNILEPAVYGLPVFFGPNWTKFNEAKSLIKSQSAFCITNPGELQNYFNPILNTDNENYKNIFNNNKNFVYSNCGGADKIIDFLKEL